MTHLTMQSLLNINLNSALDTLISCLGAFILGGIIGFERQYRQRTAGLRTCVLVAVGAAMFVDMGNRLTGSDGAVRVISYVVSGIGFLGAGVIMKDNGNVRGLNTAATLWGTAAVGAYAGADLLLEALIAALFVLAGNTLLRPAVNFINRIPLNEKDSEMNYTVCVICHKEAQKEALKKLELSLEAANYPIGSFDVRPFIDNEVQIFAVLLSTSIDSDELDTIVEQLTNTQIVNQAFWSPSVSDH